MNSTRWKSLKIVYTDGAVKEKKKMIFVRQELRVFCKILRNDAPHRLLSFGAL